MKRGQSQTEFVLILALAVSALTAMQVYVGRGLKARYKSAVDLGTQLTTQLANRDATEYPGGLRQYEPYYIRVNPTSGEAKVDSSLTTSHQTINDTYTFVNGEAKKTVNETARSRGAQQVTGDKVDAHFWK